MPIAKHARDGYGDVINLIQESPIFYLSRVLEADHQAAGFDIGEAGGGAEIGVSDEHKSGKYDANYSRENITKQFH